MHVFLLFCAFTLLCSSNSAPDGTAKKITTDAMMHTNASSDPTDAEKMLAMDNMIKSQKQQLAIAEQKEKQFEERLFECQQQYLREMFKLRNHANQLQDQVKEARKEKQRSEGVENAMMTKLLRNKQTELKLLEQQIERAKTAIARLGHQQQSAEETTQQQQLKKGQQENVEYPALANSIQFGQKRGLSPCDDFYKFVCSGQDKFYKEWDSTSTGFNADQNFNVKKEILGILFNNKVRAEIEQRIGGKFMANGFIYYDKCVNKRKEARELMKKSMAQQQQANGKNQTYNKILADLIKKHGKEFMRVEDNNFADLLNTTPTNALPMLQIKEKMIQVFLDDEAYEEYIDIRFETRLFLRKTELNDVKNNASILTIKLQAMMYDMHRLGIFGRYDANQQANEQRINDMLNIEKDFIQQSKEPRIERVTLGQLNKETEGDGNTSATAIDWVEMMKRRFLGKNIDTNTKVAVDLVLLRHWHKNFVGSIIGLEKTRANLSQREQKSAVSDYLKWHRLLAWLGPFENIAEMYNNWWSPLMSEVVALGSLYGKKNQPVKRQGEDKQFCLKEHLLEYFPHVVDRMVHELFISKNIPVEQGIVKSQQILQYVRRGFEQMLDKTENKWMDGKTRGKALQKLEAMDTIVGFLPDTLDDQKLDRDIYAGISLDATTMSWPVMFDQMLRHKQRRKFAVKGNNKAESLESLASEVLEATALFKSDNLLFVNTLMFLEPNFDLQFPDAYNFGAMGFTMGHETTHGFDNSGRKNDWEGVTLPEPGWWTEEAVYGFDERKQCLQDQYKNYEIKKYLKNADKNKTINEDIADNGGLRAAYKGWQLFKGENPDLPDKKIARIDVPIRGMNGESRLATPEQLFFIGYAFSFCRVNECDKTSSDKECRATDEHSIDRVRVNVPLRMFDQFHKAFQCPLGSPMHPEKQCRIW